MLCLKAPAKINWSLSVLGRREDGYHNIVSLMQCVDLFDILTFEPAKTLEVCSSLPAPPESNLVYRAAAALQRHAGVREGARITLRKEIPVGAGLGGGSSDAATALMGLNFLWRLGLGRESLMAVSAALGSDVPFFFRCPLAVAEGRGEILRPAGPPARLALLLVKPPLSVPTSWAYGELAGERKRGAGGGHEGASDELTRREIARNNINLICTALSTGDFVRVGSLARNDFEEVIADRFPVVARVKAELRSAGAVHALMSGSGSTVFGLFRSREAARRAEGRFPAYWTAVAETLCETPPDAVQ